jgi:hypothetical protein
VFTNGIQKLREKVLASQAQMVHLTPVVFDSVPLKGNTLPAGLPEYRKPFVDYDNVLTRYSEWLLSQRTNGWQVIDVHGPMKRELELHRQNIPSFAFATDGVHANAAGHLIMTEQILRHWNMADAFRPVDNEELVRLIRLRQKLVTDAWLSDIGHLRPGIDKGLPITEALKEESKLNEQIQNWLKQHRP